jgi:transposase
MLNVMGNGKVLTRIDFRLFRNNVKMEKPLLLTTAIFNSSHHSVLFPYRVHIELISVMADNLENRDQSPDKYLQKRSTGKTLTSKERVIVLTVYANLRKESPNELVKVTAERAAKLCGVSQRTVLQCKREFNANDGQMTTPGKKRPRGPDNKNTRMDIYDNFVLSAIRNKVHGLFRQNIPPTVKKVREAINTDPELPDFSVSTVFRLMKDLGFEYKKQKRRSIFIEREDIQLWRRRYLRQIKTARSEGKLIYYLDETWVNAGHTHSSAWTDTTIKSSKRAFLSGHTTGLKQPTGKGRRLVVGHVGCDRGFLNGGSLVFEAKKSTGDYHDEMDGPRFERWLESVIDNMVPDSVLVIDNAPYHTVEIEKSPTMSWKKGDIQDWLVGKNVAFEETMIKVELMQKVNENKPPFKKYRADEMIKEAFHTIIRLPPYHCELNPIENVWSQVKRYVAANNTTFKLDNVERLVYDGFNNVTPQQWHNYVTNVIKQEEEMWEIDGLTDHIVEQMIINTADDSDTSSEEAEDEVLATPL